MLRKRGCLHAFVGASVEWHTGYRLQFLDISLEVPTLYDDYTVTGENKISNGCMLAFPHLV